jgi:outer membrane protein assembly factor BamE (lipoprotein component of BamABCDE complex)
MKTLIRLFGILALCSFVGCTYSGREIDPNALSKIKKGKTTKSEVIALLGPPSQQMPMGYDGGVYMIYSNFKSNMANAMIPYAGAFMPTSTQSQNVQILVDGQDIVRNIVFNETSSQGSAFGMMTGQQSMMNQTSR